MTTLIDPGMTDKSARGMTTLTDQGMTTPTSPEIPGPGAGLAHTPNVFV